MKKTMLDVVLEHLDKLETRDLPVKEESGVPHSTAKKIKYRITKYPRHDTVQMLYDYFTKGKAA